MEDKRKCQYCGTELTEQELSLICENCDRNAWTEDNTQDSEEID